MYLLATIAQWASKIGCIYQHGSFQFQMRREGFTYIDALEPSDAMLEIARIDNLYNNYFVEGISREPCSLPESEFIVKIILYIKTNLEWDSEVFHALKWIKVSSILCNI